MRLISIHVQVPVVILFVALDFQLNLLVVIHVPLNYQFICFLLLFPRPRQNHRVPLVRLSLSLKAVRAVFLSILYVF